MVGRMRRPSGSGSWWTRGMLVAGLVGAVLAGEYVGGTAAAERRGQQQARAGDVTAVVAGAIAEASGAVDAASTLLAVDHDITDAEFEQWYQSTVSTGRFPGLSAL